LLQQRKKGTAYIKAKVGKKTYKCKVTVKSKKAPAKPAPTTPSAPVNPPAEPTSNTYRGSLKNTSTKCNIFKHA